MYVHICQPISFNIPCCFYCPALVWLALFDFDFGLDLELVLFFWPLLVAGMLLMSHRHAV